MRSILVVVLVAALTACDQRVPVPTPAPTRSNAPASDGSGEVDLGGTSHGATPAPKVDLTTPVAKADGETGRTVAEVYAQKAELKGKSVAVRGKVVKFLSGIMGKNWIHLQDGSGKSEDGTHDLTVTTSGSAAVGDLIVVRGAVGVDVDFGSGYFYSVILEDAAVEK